MPSSRALSRWIRSLAAAGLLISSAAASAAEVKIFRTHGRAAALQAEADGVSVGELGEIQLSPSFDRLAGLAEPYLFSAALHPEGGLVVGTGNEAKVFRIGADGAAAALADLEGLGVSAVHATRGGRVLAASSPDGAVMSLPRGEGAEPETFFAPGAAYVWDLAEDAAGRVLVATGLPGQLWRVPAEGGEGELLYSSPDRHVRAVHVRPNGTIILGTAGQGLIVEIDSSGRARTLHDGGEPEVLAFAEGTSAAGETLLYAALLASEASQVDLSAQAQAAEGEGASAAPGAQEVTLGSRGAGYDGPRSRVVRLSGGGSAGAESVAELDDETIHALAFHGGSLWIGTGQEGHLYRLEDEELILESSFEETQIVALLSDSRDLAVATTDAAAVHRWAGERLAEGTLTSKILDAGLAARFGMVRWWGEQPGGSRVAVEARAGMSAQPDGTWSEWLEVAPSGGDGADGALPEAVGVGRYAQWRARLMRGEGGASPRIDSIELSYRQINRAPEVTVFGALPPGEILVPQSFNPTTTTFEPWSPNREGIFTSIQPEKNDGSQKNLFKKGYRTLRWQGEDDNEDTILYRLEVRPAEVRPAEVRPAGEEDWLPMARELEQDWYSFDSTVLPDGVYRFRITADDRRDNPHGDALEHSRTSPRVIVDHSPPALVASERQEGSLLLTVSDEHNPIRNAVYSVDAREWRSAESADGLLDGRQERLRLEVPEDARLVLLRLTDAAFNVVTLNLSDR
ncbi:MAG: hypothetical protein AAF725_05260 [Acidobacteriota bacterium]